MAMVLLLLIVFARGSGKVTSLVRWCCMSEHDRASDLSACRRALAGTFRSSGRVVSKILLSIVFFAVVTPIGILRRLFGKDSLKSACFQGEQRIGHGGEEPHVRSVGPLERPLLITKGVTMDFLKDLWGFLKNRKKFWLLPLILILLGFGALVVFAGGSAIAPFIYTLF